MLVTKEAASLPASAVSFEGNGVVTGTGVVVVVPLASNTAVGSPSAPSSLLMFSRVRCSLAIGSASFAV